MPENASTIIVHYIENSSNLYFIIMACCVVLIVILVLVLLIIVGIVLYVLICFKKNFRLKPQSPRESLKSQEDRLSHINDEEISSCNAAPGSTERDFGTEVNYNIQSIPLSTFERPEDRLGDSSGSSAGLYDVLFPPQHEGEIIYEPPTKLMAFAGQVFASTRKNSKADSNLGPSGSGPKEDTVSGSLEWDYFQNSNGSGSAASEVESETGHKQIVDVCWV